MYTLYYRFLYICSLIHRSRPIVCLQCIPECTDSSWLPQLVRNPIQTPNAVDSMTTPALLSCISDLKCHSDSYKTPDDGVLEDNRTRPGALSSLNCLSCSCILAACPLLLRCCYKWFQRLWFNPGALGPNWLRSPACQCWVARKVPRTPNPKF